LESVGQMQDIGPSVLTVWLESKVVIIGGMMFLNLQGEHNESLYVLVELMELEPVDKNDSWTH